jgi:arylformamidase
MAPEWRVEFDAEVVFSNGGALRTQGFRLDIPGAEISDEELAELLIRHLGLLMVGAVTFTRKTLIQEPHKGSRGVAAAPGARRVIDLGEATLSTPDATLAGLVDLPGLVVRVLGGASDIDRSALAPFELTGHAVVLHGGGLTADAAAWLAEQKPALVACAAGAHPAGTPVLTGLTGIESLPPNNFRLHAVPMGTSCRVYAIAT